MNLLIVSASQRAPSQSAKVAGYLAEVVKGFEQVTHLPLCEYELGYWDGDDDSKANKGSCWPLIEKKVRAADALVLISPEWNGMVTPLLKSFLMMCDIADTAHKPALLVSVVNGISGAYPIVEMRMSMKNNKLVALPDHLIVRQVEQVLNGPQAASQRDTNLRRRIDYYLHLLGRYSKALKPIRLSEQTEPFPYSQDFAYGM